MGAVVAIFIYNKISTTLWRVPSFHLGQPLPPLSPFPCSICTIICLPGCSAKCCEKSKTKRKRSHTKKHKKHSVNTIKGKSHKNHKDLLPTMPSLPLSRFVVRPTMPSPPTVCCDADHPVILNCDLPPCQPTGCILCYNPSPPNIMVPAIPV